MGVYFEAGVGKAVGSNSRQLGHHAAAEALSQLIHYKPSLALVFASPELDLAHVSSGIVETLGDCPVIGTSTAGEIANSPITHGVVVTLLASPHLRVRVGIGEGVSKDFRRAVHEALADAGVSRYFSAGHPFHHMMHVSTSRKPRVSPVLLIMFSPGATKTHVSFSHDIHTMLRKASANRIPIFGGSSGDYFRFESNYQIIGNRLASDALVLAFIESEILFGLGMAHGFSPTTKRALITNASGHIVHELDRRPAAEVCAGLLGIPMEKLGHDAVWFSQFPFGATDLYGNSILQVPEQVLEDGSIQFAPLMRNDQVITLMRGTRRDIAGAGLSTYNKAILQGDLKRPALALMFSCALRMRLLGSLQDKEVSSVFRKARIPVSGFYTFGEQGISDDGLPIYANQSVTTLVFSDELNPMAALIHKSKNIYLEFKSQLDRKVSQIKAINRINQVIEEQTEPGPLLTVLARELITLLPWAYSAFYLPAWEPMSYALAASSEQGIFPEHLKTEDITKDRDSFRLDSHGKHFGVLILRQKSGALPPDDEDLVLAETIGKLTAGSLYRIDLDHGLDMKIQQFEVLNQLGRELSESMSADTQLQKVIGHIRSILGLSMVSLWLVDPAYPLLVKEAVNTDPGIKVGEEETENDEIITKWQRKYCRALSVTDAEGDQCPVQLFIPFPFQFTTLPVLFKGQLRGVLNLYAKTYHDQPVQPGCVAGDIEFLKAIATQIAVFIGNRSIQKDTTFFKEIHHRVKNNLQNIASLLRMQIRRLDRVTAEQALTDSISRIMSIAVVHETLSRGEIGMVNLGQLLNSISELSLAGQLEKPSVTLDISGPTIMIPSREATALALSINELIQNAVQHGFKDRTQGRLWVSVARADGLVSVTVRDDGPGLPADFDLNRTISLGLTIVRTLVKDELKGEFTIWNSGGTTAKVAFPVSAGDYHNIK
ncbi:MAG: putative sensor histidine kinase pdtaS [Syntrophorhabdus sp. PtaB.Bin006]|nr:MAG: putative sensor histidine kinase pdtaS [Syntrophorhabdus sp. PtaB.Bin006]